MTLLQRTIQLLRDSGFAAASVETWIPRLNRRRDMFGAFDAIGFSGRHSPAVTLVQVTSRGNLSSRRKKVEACPELPVLLAAGVQIELHGWYKEGGRWQVKREIVMPGDMKAVVVSLPRRRGRQTHTQGLLFVDQEQPEQALEVTGQTGEIATP